MDKHDRPYKCNVKGCEKLQGFTYSGGLLRHEREVHKMHGGTNKGAPRGDRNGAYRHGGETKEAIALRAAARRLMCALTARPAA